MHADADIAGEGATDGVPVARRPKTERSAAEAGLEAAASVSGLAVIPSFFTLKVTCGASRAAPPTATPSTDCVGAHPSVGSDAVQSAPRPHQASLDHQDHSAACAEEAPPVHAESLGEATDGALDRARPSPTRATMSWIDMDAGPASTTATTVEFARRPRVLTPAFA